MVLDYYKKKVDDFQSIFENIKGIRTELKKLKEEENKQERETKKQELTDCYNQLMGNNKSVIAFIEMSNTNDKRLNADDFRSYWAKNRKKDSVDLELLNKFKIIPDITDSYISSLPKYSFAIQFKFTLATSYISKDDTDFYIIDNPVKKDWVFKVPMVSPSTWKGQLRWTIRKNKGFTDDFTEDDHQIRRLFGNERETEDLQCGRLIFYPTFFDKVDVEVINPHNRKTKAGTNPIYIEVVPPPGASGTFTLLYVPFGNKECDRDTIIGDLKVVSEGIKEMMLIYGFSAKKANGCGVIQDNINNGFLFFNELTGEKEKREIEERLSKMSIPPEIKPDDLDESGNFKVYDKKARKDWGKKKNRNYQDKKKKWEEYKRDKNELEDRLELEVLNKSGPKKFMEEFSKIDKLQELTGKLERNDE